MLEILGTIEIPDHNCLQPGSQVMPKTRQYPTTPHITDIKRNTPSISYKLLSLEHFKRTYGANWKICIIINVMYLFSYPLPLAILFAQFGDICNI